MKINCKKCGATRIVKVDPKHESKESYEKRRSFCKICSGINRMQALGGHAPNWKGGKTIDKKGYKRIWIEKIGYKKEHHVVWMRENGAIPKNFIIHHKDGDKLNNSLDNLECMSKKEHDKLNLSLRRNHYNNKLKKIENLCVEYYSVGVMERDYNH